jgi:peptidoglycan pentaglycine glycine transferase (the first glycine)
MMLKCKVVKDIVWGKFMGRNPDFPFMQSNFWCEFREIVGWESRHIGVFKDENLIAGTTVLKFIGKGNEPTNFLSIPEGPLLPYEDKNAEKYWKMIQDLIEKDFIDKSPYKKTLYLRIEPRTENHREIFKDFIDAKDSLEPRNTLVIDLNKSEEELLKAMRPKARYNIKIAKKYRIKVREGLNQKNYDNFVNLYSETVGRKNFPAKQKFYFEKLLPILERQKTGTLFTAEYKGIPLASALVILFGNRATYFFGGSSGLHREKMAPYLLHLEIMRFAKNRGFKEYDLWGIAPPKEENHPWKSITVFKKKFGGKELNFLPSLEKKY